MSHANGSEADASKASRLLVLLVGVMVLVIGLFAIRSLIDATSDRVARRNDSGKTVVNTTTVDSKEVQSLRIDWGSGSVYVGVADDAEADGEILIRETYPDTGEGDHPLQLEVEQGELAIGLGTTDTKRFPETSRYLEVLLPPDYEGELDEVRVTMAAGEFEASQIGCAQLWAEASSGRILIDGAAADDLRLVITSGDAKVEGAFSNDVQLDVSSGSIDVTNTVTPRTCKVTVGAGEAVLALPRDANVAIRSRVGSGSFDLGFAHRNEGDSLLVGKGGYQINTLVADVGSGSLRIEPI